MHSYLIIGRDSEKVDKKIDEIANKFGARIFEHPVNKIEDARELNRITKFKSDKPTLYSIKSIDSSTNEALNAILKTVEEPPNLTYFAMSAVSIHKILPTITSRCQVIYIKNSKDKTKADIQSLKFFDLSPGVMLGEITKLGSREEAVSFMENKIENLHKALCAKINVKMYNLYLKRTLETRSALMLNGNVKLHLTRLVANLSS